MTTCDFLEAFDCSQSDCCDDSDYIPSTDSDSGDEVEPSPKKKKHKNNSDIPMVSHSCESDDDVPLAQLRKTVKRRLADEYSQQKLADIFDSPMWTSVDFTPPITTFTGDIEIPPNNLMDPLFYFRQMITNEMIENVEQQTNLYSVQKDGKSVNTSKTEIDLFIGMYLRMGLIQTYSVRAFWAEDTRCEKIADLMSRNRFEKLATCIHFVDNESVSEHEKHNKVWKVKPWLDDICLCLKNLTQEEHSAVDEIMVPFKGRSNIKQYMRNKPHKWGFKIWGRAGVSGMLYEFEVYQGASDNTVESNSKLSKTGDVVMRMTSNLADHANYKVFADNLFTSLALLEALKARGIFYVGTVRINRLKGCKLKSEKELKKIGRGSIDTQVDANSDCVIVRWFDNRTVDILSSYVGVEPIAKVNRFDKKGKKMVTVNCPAVIKEYNKFMGGIDLHDMLTALYRYPMKARRWYIYIFLYTVNMMVVNAWLRYRKHAESLKVKSMMKLAHFQGKLAYQLVAPITLVGRPRNSDSFVQPPASRKRKAPPKEVRKDGQHHLPKYSTSRGRCKMAGCMSLSYIVCSKCETFLCLNKDRNCFEQFHL